MILRRFMERQTNEPNRQNAYRTEMKPGGNPACKTCHAVNIRGKWVPERAAIRELPKGAKSLDGLPKSLCPACEQMRDQYAMGVIELHGSRWKEKTDEILRTIENTEQIARARNDQERLLWSRTYRGVTRIYVSLPELARMVGRTLQRAFKGRTEYHGGTEEPFLRVVWNSDDEARRDAAVHRAQHRSKHWRSRGAR